MFTGIAGLLPVHPRTYMSAWRNRQTAEKNAELEAARQTAEGTAESSS